MIASVHYGMPQSAAAGPVKIPTRTIGYLKEVKPLLDKRCAVCHSLQFALSAETRLL
jgi:hypothetical protein